MKTVKIQDTKYILNTNRNALEQYKLERQRREAEKNDINRMKEDIVELKKMIKKLLGKQNG